MKRMSLKPIGDSVFPRFSTWRRFVPVNLSDDYELEKLERLIQEKQLSKEDLVLILSAIELNPKFKRNKEERVKCQI